MVNLTQPCMEVYLEFWIQKLLNKFYSSNRKHKKKEGEGFCWAPDFEVRLRSSNDSLPGACASAYGQSIHVQIHDRCRHLFLETVGNALSTLILNNP